MRIVQFFNSVAALYVIKIAAKRKKKRDYRSEVFPNLNSPYVNIYVFHLNDHKGINCKYLNIFLEWFQETRSR